jgi:hypothetical protein
VKRYRELYIDWRCPFFVSFFGQAKKENKSAPQALWNTTPISSWLIYSDSIPFHDGNFLLSLCRR